MLRGVMRTMRYARSWENGAAVVLHETTIERDGTILPATFVVPASHRGDLPGWILLGGVTSMGRFHPQLARFSQALAASGAGVIVPEVPEWRDLRLTPGMTVPTIQAALCVLDRRPEVRHGKVGLIGISFGAPQAAIASSHEDLAERIAAVVTFGGYCDLERTLRCQLTGLHEWDGVTRRIDPDPYGRWVLASNYLTEVPGCEEAADVAASLRRLALSATQQRLPAWDSRHDVLKGELRSCLAARWQALFDLFAPAAASSLVGGEECEAMAVALAAACRSSAPLLDPKSAIGQMRVPIHIFHGRGDRLVPYTESLRFKKALPDDLAAAVTVTRLFAHSARHRPSSVVARVREGLTLFKALRGMLNAVG
jgi:pimeloyl-ACP methyl ester carboxylesterase